MSRYHCKTSMAKEAGRNYLSLCRQQVDWYKRYGKHPDERIAIDGDGVRYVVGDWSWNRARQHDGKWESVESRMDFPADI